MLDMVRSLGLVGLAVVGMVMFTQRNEPAHPPVSPDLAATVSAARATADFPVLAATVLPSGIYANAARLEKAADNHWTFHIGYTDGESGFLSVDASSAVGTERMPAPFPNATPSANGTIAGITFDVYTESEAQVWFHPATASEPYAMQVSCNALASCDAMRAALSADGEIATTS